MELFENIANRIFTDGSLTAFVLFWGLVFSNIYHIRNNKIMHNQSRADLAEAWTQVWEISNSTNKALGDLTSGLLLLKDRIERK